VALRWSLGSILIKSIQWRPPMAIAAGRSAIAIPVMLLLISRPHFIFSRAQVGDAIGYALAVALFVFATRMTTAAKCYFSPIHRADLRRAPWSLVSRRARIAG
jgi:drug/metabolite transporter (DMT)-like permease